MLDPPGPGIELVSPASQGGFLTTGPPGNNDIISINKLNYKYNLVYILKTAILTCSEKHDIFICSYKKQNRKIEKTFLKKENKKLSCYIFLSHTD